MSRAIDLIINLKHMKSILFSINGRDLFKGLVIVLLGAVFGAFQQMLTEHGLEFSAYNWDQIIQVAFTAGFAYLSKNFISDENDKVLGAL